MRSNTPKMLLLLLPFIFLNPCTSSCSVGCLSCDQITQECRVCDSLNMYYLSASSCNKSSVSNCYRVDSRGHCIQCITGYYYDIDKQDCLEVPRAYLLQNCVSYSRFNFCAKCNADSYLTSTGNCLPVPVRIEHCNEYQTDNPAVCLQCFVNYVLKFDGSECVSVESLDAEASDENCGSYSRFKCQECHSPYILSPSAYSEYQPLLHDSDFSAFLWYAHFSFSDRQFVFRTCEKPETSNCSQMDPYLLECQSCDDGFYFSDKTRHCEVNPAPQIKNCITYTTATLCFECASGFHLATGKTACQENTEIDQCLVFDGTVEGTTKCKECNETHKLAGDALSCIVRTTPSIENCEKLSISAETCDTCATGTVITTDSTKCLPGIPNCLTYANSSSTSTNHTCTECQPGFMYTTADNLCDIPVGDNQVEYCEVYQNDNGGCLTCHNFFYFDTDSCKPHRFMPNCKQTSGSTPHTCDICNLGFVNMNSANQCHQGSLIPNCLINLTETTCSQCKEGFYGPLCAQIPYTQKCLQVDPSDSNICLKCMSGHYLESGTCRSAEDYELRYCQKLGGHTCEQCRPFSVLVGVQEFSICRPRSSNANTPSLCVRFNVGNDQCLECQSGFFLDNNRCVKACPSVRSSLILRQYVESNNILVLGAVNKCIDGSDENNQLCEVFVPDSRDPTKILCAKCKSGSVPGIDPSTMSHHMFVIPNSSTTENVTMDHSMASPGLTCLTSTNLDMIQNCEFWSEMSGQKRCVKCRYGYKGEITYDSSNSYLTKCIKDFECSRNKIPFSTGLGMHSLFQNLYPMSVPSSLLSCYYCTSGSEIPFLYANNSALGLKLTNFDISDAVNMESTSTTTDDYSHMCHDPSSFKFYNNPSSSISGFPNNCAIGLIDPSVNIGTNGRSTYLQCLACREGYKATFSGNFISECSGIGNCEKSWEFGECSLCAGGFVWEYSSSGGFIDKTSCIAFVDRQCISGYDLGGQQICRVCKSGFSPNVDGICEKLMPSFCASGFVANSPQPNLSSEIESIRDMLKFLPKGLGCQECSHQGQTLMKIGDKRMMCIPSYFAQWNQFPTQTLMIPNCEQYSYELTDTLINDFSEFQTVPKCLKCSSGYLETVDGRSCYTMSSSLIQCLLVDSSNGECTLCAEHYLVVGGVCQANAIEFCQTAFYDNPSTSIKCSLCDDGYYFDSSVSSTSCMPGLIPHCKVYNATDSLDCLTCEEDYQAVPINGSKRQCLSLKGTKCKTLDISSPNLSSNSFDCQQCEPGYYPSPYDITKLDSKQSFCLSLAPVSGCTAINVGTLSSATFECSACEASTHFLTGSPQTCQLRRVIDHCSQYDLTLDECDVCDTGFYLSSDKLTCVANPVGVQYCVQHDSSGIICKYCDSDHYLYGSGDTCNSLPEEDKKSNCVAHDQSKICVKCEDNYFLNHRQCEEITAQNCLTVASATSCATCPNMYYLDTDTSASPRSCIQLNITNCIENDGNKCSLCDQGNKLSADGTTCSSASLPKPNCFAYNSSQTCVRCESPFILNPETGKCLIEESMEKYLDPNCSNFLLSPQCNTCKQGYYFDSEGKCKECEIEGCHFCSRGGHRCNLCLTGFYMDQSGACVRNSKVDFDSFEVVDDAEESVKVSWGLVWMVMMVGVWFW